jgi:hypothetical protein
MASILSDRKLKLKDLDSLLSPKVGIAVGCMDNVGAFVGSVLGDAEGHVVGEADGSKLGCSDGCIDKVGALVEDSVGSGVGT